LHDRRSACTLDTVSDPELDETASIVDVTPVSLSKARELRARIEVGDRLGRYEVRALLGRGGMGEVFEAYDPELDRVVALKVIRPDFVETSSRARVRFVREAQVMGRLNHPNVVSIYDVGSRGDPRVRRHGAPSHGHADLAPELGRGRSCIDRDRGDERREPPRPANTKRSAAPSARGPRSADRRVAGAEPTGLRRETAAT
jgi:hypothetical protein